MRLFTSTPHRLSQPHQEKVSAISLLLQLYSNPFFSAIQRNVVDSHLTFPCLRRNLARMSTHSLTVELDSLHFARNNISTVTGSATAALETFTPFPKLPLELRLKVWRSTFIPRTVEVELTYTLVGKEVLITLTENPTTLWVNRESRSETLQHYSLLFAKISQSPLYFCCAIDSLLVDTPTSSNLFSGSINLGIVRSSDPEGASKIQSLTFAKASWDDTISTIFQQSLEEFRAKILEDREHREELRRNSPEALNKPVVVQEEYKGEKEEELPSHVFAFHNLKEIVFCIGGEDMERLLPNILESPQGRRKCKEDWIQFFRSMQVLFPLCKIPTILFRQHDDTE